MPPNLRDQTFVSGDPSAVIVNASIIDVFDEIAFALLIAGDFFADAMLQAAVVCHPVQQPARMSFAFPSVRPE